MSALTSLVERLELERATGMPRWNVGPTVTPDPLPVTAQRLRTLAAAAETPRTAVAA